MSPSHLEEGVGGAGLAGPAGPPDPVHVVLDGQGEGVVDDEIDA